MKALAPILLLPALLAIPGLVRAQDATIHFKSGRTLAADIVSVDKENVHWRLDAVSKDVQETPHAQIEYVDFPPIAGWEDAETAFDEGRLEDAAELYEKFAAIQFSGNYYPAPGNFSTLARRRLFDIYSRLVNPEALARYYDRIRIDLLPAAERDLSPVLACWNAAGKKKWEQLIEIAGKIENLDPVSREAAELGYLKGLAYTELGDFNRALTEFGRAYTLNLGTDSELAKTALRHSADLIESLGVKERNAETQALIHVYAEVYGNNALWEDASSKFQALQKLELRSSYEESEDKTGQVAAADVDKLVETTDYESVMPPKPQEIAAVTPVGGTGLEPESEPEPDPAKPAAPTKIAADGTIFKVSFNPGALKGNASDPKYNLYQDKSGAARFRVKSGRHTYTLTSAQAGSGVVYEADGEYEFSITSYCPDSKEKRAECVIELGYLEEGRFLNVERHLGSACKDGKGGYNNRVRNKVVGRVETGDAAVGKPVTIRLKGNGNKEVHFVGDGTVTKLP